VRRRWRDGSNPGYGLDRRIVVDTDDRRTVHDGGTASSEHAEGSVPVEQRHPSKQWGRR
jgi:hypothetical protein